MNKLSIQIFSYLKDRLAHAPALHWKRLARNQCWIAEYDGHYYVKSYNTICGISYGDKLLVPGYWSSTTCQHMHKAARELNLQHYRCDKEK